MSEISGVYTALITPFTDSGAVDYESLNKLIDFQYKNGIKKFVVNGTTAESPTLSKDEVQKIYECVRSFNQDIQIILGTGSNSTQKTIEATQWAENMGADGALVVVPYYNKPTQEGLVHHFKNVAASVHFPITLYNVPGRTVVSMSDETLATLNSVDNICAIKEASGDLALMQSMKSKSESTFKILSGDDDTCLALCLMGGHGVISVVSHLIPKEMVSMIEKARKADDTAIQEYKKFKNLLKYLYIEPNPVPAKMALYLMGIIKSANVRLPLMQMTSTNSKLFKEELASLELL